MNQKGFTLLELLVVIVIMGIVAMLATPQISPIFTNIQKDQVLNEARDIERAARFFCGSRTSSDQTCDPGVRLERDVLDELISSDIDASYDYHVTILHTGNFAVYLAKEDAYSFPFNQRGYLATSERVPTETGREYVNVPSFLGAEYPPFSANTYTVGDRFTFNERSFEILEPEGANIPPTEDNLLNYDYWQEVRIGDAFRLHNRYEINQMVSYQDRFYYLRTLAGNGEAPDISIYWQEITNQWRTYNYYVSGDIVRHEGDQYQAIASDFYGAEPGTSGSLGQWQNITTIFWSEYNLYQQGDVVIYIDPITGEANQYEALQDIDQNTPSVHISNPDYWFEYPGDPWDATEAYFEGDVVYFDGQLYIAQWYNRNRPPGAYDEATNPNYVWRPVVD